MKNPKRSINKVKETCPSFRRGHIASDEDVQRYRSLTLPHVDSFNYFLEEGLSRGIRDIEPAELDIMNIQKMREGGKIDLNEVSTVKFWMEDVKVAKPTKAASGRSNKLLPRECRERKIVYAGQIFGKFCYRIVQRRNGVEILGPPTKIAKSFGNMPIMVLSKACHLEGMMPKALVKHREEVSLLLVTFRWYKDRGSEARLTLDLLCTRHLQDNEFGGYFIMNGIERCVRMLQIPRRNHPTAIQRSNYKNRGPTYTDLGVAIRCARHNGDQSSITNTIHYLTTGGATLKFVARKQEILIPISLILRALSGPQAIASPDDAAGGSSIGITDEELYRRIVQGDESNTFLRARAELLLQDARARFPNLNTPNECLAYIGTRFRRLSQRAETTSNIAIGHYMIRRYVLIHLPSYKDKLECILLLLRKLYSFAAGNCGVDNADSLQNQELLMPGHLMCSLVKEKFDEMLQNIRLGMVTEMRKDFSRFAGKIQDTTFWGKLVDRYSGNSSGGIGKKVGHFLSTGNIISSTGLDLLQVSGYTIVAERLNFLRYSSHFRSVHRGQFFLEMKTTAVRKLLPDQWGFLCPVHTPDGGPCGLLSHLSLKCSAMTYPAEKNKKGMRDLDDLLTCLGVSPAGAGGQSGEGRASSTHTNFPVCLDGRLIGTACPNTCKAIAAHLRMLKVTEPPQVPETLEVALIPASDAGSPYPGLFLFSGAARLVRPVLHRATGKTEMIGPMEQAFMDIACLDGDVREGITTHQELDPTNMLSLIANLTPFSDQNQSPRNMYQCQMGKQTMGTPGHSLPFRTDNKLYKLQNPQAPVVQTSTHSEFKMDEYPNGCNAVVGA
jgi:DNA-directed RNA polymerase I subunit RPA2